MSVPVSCDSMAVRFSRLSAARNCCNRSRKAGTLPGATAIAKGGLAEQADAIDKNVLRLHFGSAAARRNVGSLTVDTLRGVEGDCARAYFGVFDHLILANKGEFTFQGRSRRPPLDRVNALLSFAYTLLVHDVTGALESVGLDPCVGFLHTDRPGRPGLALDLMEELRPILADRLVLSLINRQQVTAKNFTVYENGAVWMDEAGRREVLQSWQKRKKEEVLHPFLEETIELGLFPHVQALLLARWLRGDLDGYAALIWR